MEWTGDKDFIEKRFWPKVNKIEGGCWEWIACITTGGYGQCVYGKEKLASHRVSWQLTCGPIPDKLFVLHKCDNRKCVNPDHLFLGTQKQNMKDCIEKGRFGSGVKQHKAVLNDQKVREIILLKGTMPKASVADRYGVEETTIRNVWARKTWKHVEVGL